MPKPKITDSFREHYNQLNSEQKQAVDMTSGPLLVLAGPGTGKTQLLSIRAANILQSETIDPESVLVLTFTNAAAKAMRDRLARIIGPRGYDVTVETFHSFANSIVLESERAIQYVKDKIEINEVEKVRALEHILDNVKGAQNLRTFGAPYIHRREIEKRISELKNEGISPGEFKDSLEGLKPDGVNLEEKHIPRLNSLAAIYENYEKYKAEDSAKLFDERGRIDYDDMILIALEALKKDEELRSLFRQQYKYIMVDEYQDTNGAQLKLLFSILDPASNNICCVGDDDQAIYRFQGATLSNFRVLKEKLPELRTISLKNNYRSTDDIVEISDKIITQLPEDERIVVKKLTACRDYNEKNIRFLEFSTEEEEFAFMLEEIERQVEKIKKDKSLSSEEKQKPFNNIAVLVRKRAQILKLVNAFLKAGIPYATDGKEDIRHEKRVRQMLDVLELAHLDAENTEKRSFALYKVLTADYIGASQSDILKIIGLVNEDKRLARGRGAQEYGSISLFQQFQEYFTHFSGKDENDLFSAPSKEESEGLEISRKLKLENPHALHKAAWAINRLLVDANSRPVHDILMGYVGDVQLYRFIAKRYDKDKILKIRDLRSLVSFINMVKKSDLASPALGLDDFMKELDLRETHNMPIQGELATLNQDGVRIYTVHSAKGLEFYTVLMPFCLQQKSWPLRRKPDVVPLPLHIYRDKVRLEEKSKLKILNLYDERRLFYVASTRAKSHLIYTATPAEKVIVSPFVSQLNIDSGEEVFLDEEKFLGKFLKQKEEKDSFAGTSGILKDLISSLTLNPTSLNNYISCKRKFLYDNVLRLPGKKNQNLVFGNCAHKALEEVYTVFMEKNKFPDFSVFKKSFEEELKYQGVNDSIKYGCHNKLEKLKEWYTGESALPIMPIDLENKLEVTLPGGLVFRGTFDKIEKEATGEIKVVDYKTGKPDKHVKAIANCRNLSEYKCDDYFRQLIAYKMLYEENRKGEGEKYTVTKGVLQFLEPVSATVIKYDLQKGAYRNEVVELTDDMVRELRQVITKCWKDIQALKFDKLSERDDKQRCRYCTYDNICWGE